ncbi:hypothetical protein LOTGIDRAFT_152129 [Lottia gigantea]|uniref:Asl1-like glycosyl hydrolase catalytic domain-containing protein n=1 Tax=Lottia gigantea TaxID=225164 RepID=V4AM76_LOTGI|nr:hypothetical protein LOTGIDRAFT_152129 [Lottia gigantea]ESP05299.1 hypothetical protein LOTGIDRAFT_152129 [Lottia gigantea]
MLARLVVTLTAIGIWFINCSQKKGICMSPGQYFCNDTYAFQDISWWYDWHTDQIEHHRHNCHNTPRGEYVPMLWGEARMNTSTVPNQAKHVLGFNEPNVKSQANMTPQRAAQLWPEVERKSVGKTLISPAVAGCHRAQQCIHWFTEFFNGCKNCRVDALAVHAYHCNPHELINSLEKVSHHFKKKIWLTEFACHTAKTVDEQLHYMQSILPLLEASPVIERYSWFVTRFYKNTTFINTSTDLMNRHSATLNRLGKFYDDYKAH